MTADCAIAADSAWTGLAQGQTKQCPNCGYEYTWPSNDNWSQAQVLGTCPNCSHTIELQPSNWSTSAYPNGSSDVTIGSPSPAVLDVSTSIDSAVVDGVGFLNIWIGNTLSIGGPPVGNDGVIQINGGGSSGIIRITGDVALVGNGELVMQGGFHDAFLDADSGYYLNQSASHTIRGFGEVRAALINNGTVWADYTDERLYLMTGSKTNNGTVRASNGAWIEIQKPIDQSGGGQKLAEGGNIYVAPGGDQVLLRDERGHSGHPLIPVRIDAGPQAREAGEKNMGIRRLA